MSDALHKKQLSDGAKWFFLCNAILFCIIAVRYIACITPIVLPDVSFKNEILIWFFLVVAIIGQMSFIAFLPYFLLIFPLTRFLPQKKLIIICSILLAGFLTVGLTIDSFVFKQTHFHINGIFWEMLFSKHLQNIFSLSWLEYLILTIIIVVIFLFEILIAIFSWYYLVKKNYKFYQITIFTFLFSCLIVAYDIFLLATTKPELSVTQQAKALPLFTKMIEWSLPIKNNASRIENIGAGYYLQPKQSTYQVQYPLHALKLNPPHPALNIVMIVIDSWRFDTLTQDITPHIYQFAQSSWQFKHHYSGGNSTLKGIFTLFYGLPGTYWQSMVEQKQPPLLLEELINQHYRIGIFASGNVEEPPLYTSVFRDIPNLPMSTPGETPYKKDQYITQAFKKFIHEKTKEHHPFFSFLFYDAAHSYCSDGNPILKFQPNQEICNRFALDNINPVPYFNRYKNALFFVDQQINQVISTLKTNHLLKNTVVIITGDHGQEFNDNGLDYWEHATNYTRFQTQVPLIIYWPQQSPRTVNNVTSHFDIAPFLLTHLLGCKNPPSDYSIGKLLLSEEKRNYLILSSYIDFGILEPDRITTIFSTGDYLITDLTAKKLKNAKSRLDIIEQVFNDMKRFYH